jgi:hypothetical protein
VAIIIDPPKAIAPKVRHVLKPMHAREMQLQPICAKAEASTEGWVAMPLTSALSATLSPSVT